jgi:hypothetical protein
MDIEEFDINQNLIKAISMKHAKLPWNVVRSEMEERNSVGRGPIGEYVRTMWAGTEVCYFIIFVWKTPHLRERMQIHVYAISS